MENEGLEALHRLYLTSNTKLPYCKNGECLKDYELVEKELKRLEQLGIMYSNCVIEGAKQKKTLDILAKNLGLEMSIDNDFALLFVRITDNRCCIVGSVDGKQNIELLKGVLKCHEDKTPIVPNMETLVREIMSGRVVTLGEKLKNKF